MAGIYIHIPFCRKACHYCNFHFSTSASNHAEMVAAIARETVLRKGYINEAVDTIYFGGGTPSLLDTNSLQLLLETFQRGFNVPRTAEITLEANPDDISRDKLSEWKQLGINRLSIGVQSFFDRDLQWMNRAHGSQQAQRSIEEAVAMFNNITIDLIYGTPGLSDEDWIANLDKAAASGVPHLSCYALTVEPKTALDKMIRLKKKEAVEPDAQARQFALLMDWAGKAGYEHYEISNFAKPGYRSRHNSSYWQGRPYLGLGPSAHSFNGTERQWNVSNNALYLAAIHKDEVPFEKEMLTTTQKLNEYIMTSLRTIEGLSLSRIASEWTGEDAAAIRKDAAVFIHQGNMLAAGDQLVLTNNGRLLADGIAAELFR